MGGINHLPSCEIHTDEFKLVGMLYFETRTVTVLLNNVLADADLGPYEPIRNKQTCPEATIYVIPTAKIKKIIKYASDHT
ncbi:MAG: hypothetical protein A2167_04445 [Planctomycetes bacterium RBG_13_46_10]|nr:MAG: hypothetical protein A2167_04445 [Planctomycetes bacterium RBG_13_46_10]